MLNTGITRQSPIARLASTREIPRADGGRLIRTHAINGRAEPENRPTRMPTRARIDLTPYKPMNEITLRDLLAGLVAAGAAGSQHWNLCSPTSRRNLAEQAYQTADELLKARVSVQDDSSRKRTVE